MIITSLLDLDLYKLTVGEVIFTYFRNITAKYRMTVRNADKIDYRLYVQPDQINPEIANLENLSLKKEEATFLRSLNLFSEEYIQFLMSKPMAGCNVRSEFQKGNSNDYYWVPEVSGLWHKVMLYEIFCLSINNEIFAKSYAARNDIPFSAILTAGRTRLKDKITRINRYKKEERIKDGELNITEFGTRRRISKAWQQEVLQTLVDEKIVNSTSNVYLAMKLGIEVKGTFGHEFTMGMQGVSRIQDSQKEGFSLWLKHWKGKLKIALDDTLGEDKFLRDFTKDLAEAYDGCRHDSGDIEAWTNARLKMYYYFGIDAKTKTLFYSDGLDDSKIIMTHREFKNKAKLGFGVGTFFTNDTFIPVPQVVMKIMECNNQPVAKLSNNPSKASCDDKAYLEYLKHVAEVL